MKGLARIAGATVVLAAIVAPASAFAANLVPVGTVSGVAPGSTYLALGDSVTFGYEERSEEHTSELQSPEAGGGSR